VSNHSLSLEATNTAPRLARLALCEWLSQDGYSEIEAAVLLAGSELVANAVMHAGTSSTLSYASNDEFVEIGVLDGSREPVIPPGGQASAKGVARPFVRRGRGLLIVQELAKEWGVSQTRHGKRVWARWSLPP